MLEPLSLQPTTVSTLLYYFLCSATNKASCKHIHSGTWYLCTPKSVFPDHVTHIWLQNKLSPTPSEVRAVVLCQQWGLAEITAAPLTMKTSVGTATQDRSLGVANSSRPASPTVFGLPGRNGCSYIQKISRNERCLQCRKAGSNLDVNHPAKGRKKSWRMLE